MPFKNANILFLALRYLLAQPLAGVLNVVLLTLALGSVTLVLLLGTQVNRAFTRDLAGIDVVIGAKGSPLQLILAGVFHLDSPSGNIPWPAVQALQNHPQVAMLIPLSLGDTLANNGDGKGGNSAGYRIVGTTPDYVALYGAALAQGSLWAKPLDLVLGAQTAAGLGLREGVGLGQTVAGAHGLAGGGRAHGEAPYRISGVLARCQCVLDRLALTATESVWAVHGASHHDEPEEKHEDDRREVTIALVQYRSPLAAISFPRFINTTTPMQAAAPAVEITRLLRMVGVGTEVLRGFGWVMLLTAAISVFIALWSAVRERRGDLALLRLLGASPAKVAGLLWCEALWLAGFASVLGLALGHALLWAIAQWLAAAGSLALDPWVWSPIEVWVPALAVAVATVAAALPALSAYRVEAGEMLNDR